MLNNVPLHSLVVLLTDKICSVCFIVEMNIFKGYLPKVLYLYFQNYVLNAYSPSLCFYEISCRWMEIKSKERNGVESDDDDKNWTDSMTDFLHYLGFEPEDIILI